MLGAEISVSQADDRYNNQGPPWNRWLGLDDMCERQSGLADSAMAEQPRRKVL
jgi:hypothetical protein